MERASKRSRSATRVPKSAGKRKHTSKSASVSKYNKSVSKSAKISAARAVANAVTMGFMGIEKKFLDTTKSNTAIAANADCTGGEYDPSAGCTGCLSCPAQGDTEQSRDGKRIVIDSLILKGFVQNGESTGEAPEAASKIFVAVVLDTQTNGAQLNSEDVFKNTGAYALLNADPMKNLLFGGRFRILKSQTFDLTFNGVTGAVATLAHNATRRDFDWYIPFKGGLPVNLNAGTDANVTNVIDNSLHVVAFSTIAGSSIGYNARIRFQG